MLQVIRKQKLVLLLLFCHTRPRRMKEQQLGSCSFNDGLPKSHSGLQE